MRPGVTIFFINFFFSISTGLSIYVLLPFLALSMPAAYSGLAIAGGGFIALLLFPLLPRLEARLGAQQLVLFLTTLEMIALFALAAAPSAITAVVFVVAAYALQPCISYGLDLLFEAAGVGRSDAGRKRTIFLTAWNLGILVAPLLLAAVLMNTNEYSRIFIAAAALLIPCIVILTTRQLPASTASGQTGAHLRAALTLLKHDRDFSAVTFAHFLLYLFYLWAPFYTPIYLHNVLGFSWSTLGWVFALMLLPYVLVEYPAGYLADRYVGDKRLMQLGFILAGGALASVSLFTPETPVYTIAAVLFISRVGTALVESMSEGHFFRRVISHDINSMSVFRGVWPLAYTLGPIVASAILLFGSLSLFFACVGIFVLVAGVATTMCIAEAR